MTEPLSPHSLIEIEDRCSRATPGPWKSYVEGRDHSSGDNFIMTGGALPRQKYSFLLIRCLI